jgi:dCMP deaminase
MTWRILKIGLKRWIMKAKHVEAYLKTANTFANCSTAKKLKVGAVVVKDHRIVSIGYNGTPPGWDNVCEDEVYSDSDDKYHLETKPEVYHAEANAITKLARSTESGEGAEMFCTHSPCIHCAKLIAQSGITKVYYSENYRSREGVEFLKKCGVSVQKTTI